MNEKRALSKYVRVDASTERLARIWDGVSERVSQARPRLWSSWTWGGWAWRGGAVLALSAAFAFVFVLWKDRHSLPSAWQGAALETATDALSVALEDGSQMELGARTRVEVRESSSRSIVVTLSKGRVDLSVVPNPNRRFVVSALGVDVRVVGTRFSVELTPDRNQVEVRVREGTVEVAPPGSSGAERRLAAGEMWSFDARLAAADPALEPTSAPKPVLEPETPPESPSPAALPKLKPPSSDTLAPEDDSPAALLERANAARRAGEVQRAAQAYEELLSRYPGDPRSGLAAFELGRLRMDRLGNLRGAVQALRQAVTLAPGSGFREDAMARLVQAYAAMGAVDECRSARSAYLKSYPKGVHAGSVAQKCPEP